MLDLFAIAATSGFYALMGWLGRRDVVDRGIATEPVPEQGAVVAGLGALPAPYDAVAWEELAQTSQPAAKAITFWAEVMRMEPELLLPTWIELTTGEQKQLVNGFAYNNTSKLNKVLTSALPRAEPKSEDAQRRYSNEALLRAATGSW